MSPTLWLCGTVCFTFFLLHKHNMVMGYASWSNTDVHVFVPQPKSVEIILSSYEFLNKSGVYRFQAPWIGDGLLLSADGKWSERRKLMKPVFYENLDQFVEIFERHSNATVETLSGYGVRDKVDIFSVITLFALDVITETSLGTPVHAQWNNNSDYVQAVQLMGKVFHARFFDVEMTVDTFYETTPLYRMMKGALKVLHDFTDRVIRNRRDELQYNTQIEQAGQHVLLDVLLKAKHQHWPLTNQDIREELDTMILGGHDSVTVATTFSLFNIAKYPEVQRKCFEEIRRVVGDQRDKPITYQQLNSLHYLELVIKESMRLFPSVPLIGRKIFKEKNLNGRNFPAGCNFMMSIFSMGRNATLWPEPTVFRPERFENFNEKEQAFTYLPFSAGLRDCLGKKFAMLELKFLLCKLLRYFEFELAEDSLNEPNMLAEFILIPVSKIHLYIKPRAY